jgi:chromosome segregation ATPase
MTPEELRQLVESNARTAQAMLDTIADAKAEREELREGMIKLQEAVVRLTNIQQGVSNLLAALDEDRPTILRKLTTIENKLDQVLTNKPT